MILKQIIDEDFTNFKEPSMLLAFPSCDFKCGKESCHNKEYGSMPKIKISAENIVKRYISNPITSAMIFSGLEPLDSFWDMIALIAELREHSDDTVVIYTGYTEEEFGWKAFLLEEFKNIIIKFGRYIQNHESHYDETLGIYLASPNQYAKQIS